MYVGKRLVTASHESYASQDEAHGAARDTLDRIVLEWAKSRKSPGITSKVAAGP